MRNLFLAMAILSLPLTASGKGVVTQVTAANLGFSAAQSINGTPVSNGIHMDGNAGFVDKVTLLLTIVWGTTALLDITAEVSWDNTNWYDVMRCTSAATHDCAPRKWQYDPTDGTTPTLEWETGAKYIRFTFDDPGTGNGTVIASAVMGQ